MDKVLTYRDLDYVPNYNALAQDDVPYFSGQEEQYYEPPVTVEAFGGVDKKSKMMGGTVRGYVPLRKGSVSGSFSGMTSQFGPQRMRTISGADLMYNNGNFSFGGEYKHNTDMDPYSTPSPDNYANKNFLARGIIRY